jgi:hypothetical protein
MHDAKVGLQFAVAHDLTQVVVADGLQGCKHVEYIHAVRIG